MRALRRGEAVSDPRDAALAVQRAESARAMRTGAMRLPLIPEIAFAAVVLAAVFVTRDWMHLLLVAICLTGILWFRLAMARLGRIFDASVEKHRELAKRFGGTSVPPEP